jgi:hypothetical protein
MNRPFGIALILAAILLAAVTTAGCDRPAQIKYQPGDRTATAGQTEEWNFDKDAIGKPPDGAEVFSGAWAVRAESDAPSAPNALCQTATADFPALALSGKVYTDLELSARFKPTAGKDDQAAGLIFRVQDANNYYILRANALEDNVILFCYASGSRSTLKTGSARVPSGQWQELRAEANGSRLRGFLNGQLVVEATDETFKAGRVGLWTKADSVTCFDDVKVTAK